MYAVMSSVSSFGRGIRDSLPIVAGYLPVAFTFGVGAIQAGLSAGQALMISALVFAGASQFVFVALVGTGSSAWTLISAALLMNVRHAFYGPSLLSYLDRKQQRIPLALLAFGLTDEVFATAIAGTAKQKEGDMDVWLLGLETGAWSSWLSGTVLGACTGMQLLEQSAFIRDTLEFVLPALFCSLLLQCTRHGGRSAVLFALAGTALLGIWLENHLALLGGMLSGAVFGGLPLPATPAATEKKKTIKKNKK